MRKYYTIDVVAGVDVILDCIGTPYFEKNIDSLNFNGRLFIIGTLGAILYTQMDLKDLVTKRLIVQDITIFLVSYLSSCLVV